MKVVDINKKNYFKNNEGEWMAETLTKDESIIDLQKLNISFTVKQVYQD
jgi:hypothetical protein